MRNYTPETELVVVISPSSSWNLPPKNIALGNDEVHVWRAALNLTASYVQRLRQTLSTDEQARAERFHFQTDREHFVVARGLLRSILAGYLDVAPGQLRFGYSPYGKPTLAGEFEKHGICFNLSHSGGLVLYAVTRGRELGIDLERIRPDFADERIAEQFFSPRETAALRALPTSMQHVAFFNCWTRKEAFIKARGEGLSLPLDQFEVSLVPGAPAALLKTGGDALEASRWVLQELIAGTGYAAALAVEGHGWRIKCWQWSEA